MRKHHVFSTLVESQKNSYELIMTSVLIAVGVNLLSTGIIELIGFEYKEAALIAIGIIISLGVVIRISHSKIKELNQAIKIKGFIIYNKENHKILGIPEYEISTDMERYLDCAFSENKALEKLWNENNISQFEFDGREDNEAELESSRYSSDLFVELLEYCVIEKLSTHLLDYFNEFDEKQHVQEFHKNDIPEVLLSNRFLKLFSEDMRNREIFVCQDGYWGDDASDGIVVAQNASGGLYQRFDLILPEKAKLSGKIKMKLLLKHLYLH